MSQFFLAYKSLCPSAWVERWEDQRSKSMERIRSRKITDVELQALELSQFVWISENINSGELWKGWGIGERRIINAVYHIRVNHAT